MSLTLFAFAVAFIAIIRGAMLSARVRKLREERDALMGTVAEQRRQLEQLRAGGTTADGSHRIEEAGPGPWIMPGQERGRVEDRPIPSEDKGRPAPAAASAALSPPPMRGPTPAESESPRPAPDALPGIAAAPPRITPPATEAEPGRPGFGLPAIEALPASALSDASEATTGAGLAATSSPEHAAPEAGSAPTDWESFLGIKGAAWMGGIAFMLAAIFFARWSIAEGLVSAQVSFAVMLLLGLGAFAAGEALSRFGLRRATSPVLSAGIAILYAAFLAAHSRYDLIGFPFAFAALGVVTIAGGVLAVRHHTFAPALLSLLGGLATAFALASDEGQTLAAFGAALLLNLGLLPVIARRPWFGLLSIGLAGTLVLEIQWFWSSLSPESMELGAGIALVFGGFYLFLPALARNGTNPRVLRISALGAAAPFLFAFILGTSARYVGQWPLLFGMLALLNIATLVVSVRGGRAAFLRRAAIATGFILAWWALQGLKAESSASLFGSTLSAVLIVAIFGMARRVALRFGALDDAGLRVLESAALAAGIGLGLFGVVMILYDRGAPVGPFLTLATALVLLLVEMSDHDGRLSGVLAVGAFGLATLTQIWLFSAVNATTLVSYLAGPVVVSLLFWFLAERKTAHGFDLEAEIAVQISGWIAILGLFLALVESDRTSTGWPLFLPLASTGWPLFLALVIQLAVLIASVLRSKWTPVLPALAGAGALHILLWQGSYLSPDQYAMTLGFTLLIYGVFLLLPLAGFAGWRGSPWPWLASALAGPIIYFPLRALYQAALGDASIGLVPLALAAVAAALLAEVSRRFRADPGDLEAARLRLRYLTLYSAVTAWLLAAAVQIQFDREWMTLGWALLAVGLCWLHSRLPHAGLVGFAAILFVFVAARLLFNPGVLGYEPRGSPVLNWVLYTYGLAGVCCYVAQRLLRRASSDRWIRLLADAVSLTGLLFAFWLVNLEILDYFSEGAYITLSGHEGYSVKLAFSVGWGVFAVALLAAGVARNVRPLRYLSLAFMILAVAKVFLYDLAALEGFFQVFSLFGLAAGLLLVSFFYQRFVFRKAP